MRSFRNLTLVNHCPALAPQREWDTELTKRIRETTATNLFDGQAVKDLSLANAVKSGLLLWNDALDDSHDISQSIRSKTGSYWHGIMHRREPDYSNSKYWFARVGNHPIFPTLRGRVLELFKAEPSPSPQTRSLRRGNQAKRQLGRPAIYRLVPRTPRDMPMARSLSSCKRCRSRKSNSCSTTPVEMLLPESS